MASRSSTTTVSSIRISSIAAAINYKAPWNTIFNTARVYTPADTAIQTPNSDTPYSFVGADLRAEPLVLSVPAIDKDRYYSLQFIDMYTFNFAYVGSRATGNDAGNFLLAGPNWQWRNAARRQASDPVGDRVRVRPLPDPAFQSRGHRKRQENPGRVQGPAVVAIPRQAGAPCPARRRLHQAAEPGGGENLARVFHHPQFRAWVLPAEPGRDGDARPVRQARRRPTWDVDAPSFVRGNAQSG